MERFKSSYSGSMFLATCVLLLFLLWAVGAIVGQMARMPAESAGEPAAGRAEGWFLYHFRCKA